MVEAQTSVPYAIVGGILALLVFLIICVLVGMVWCSVRQKGEWGRGQIQRRVWLVVASRRGWGLEPDSTEGGRRSRIANLRPRSRKGRVFRSSILKGVKGWT